MMAHPSFLDLLLQHLTGFHILLPLPSLKLNIAGFLCSLHLGYVSIEGLIVFSLLRLDLRLLLQLHCPLPGDLGNADLLSQPL